MAKVQTIEDILANGLRIADENINVPIDDIIIEAGLINNLADIIAKLSLGKKFLIVSDVNTHKVTGQKIAKSFAGAKEIILENGVKPDIASVAKIRKVSEKFDAIIAFGSGTINDICKYASYLESKPYIIVATAPSMNGYCSANASISEKGFKNTLAAHLPKAVIMDLAILAKAPKRLIQSGLGDSLCRTTAQADWLLSHLLLGTKYDATPFELLAPYEKNLFANSQGLIQGDAEIMKLLCQTLIVSGIGMYISKGSYPASQGEHMIAHTMEMKFDKNLPDNFHGEEIAVTTLTMAKIQNEILEIEPEFRPKKDCAEEIKAYFPANIAQKAIGQYEQKLSVAENIGDINWLDIRSELNDIMLPYSQLEKTLKACGAPTNASGIGWNIESYMQAISKAKYSRNRFTFLDFV